MKIRITFIHRTLKIAKVYTGIVCLSKLWQECSQQKLAERVGIDTQFAVMTWESNSICISTVQLFLLTCGWVRASQSTWTSVLAGWLPITLFWLLPHGGKWGKGKRGCWWPLCSPTPRAASGSVCCGSCFFCIWNSLAQAAWSLGWWVRTDRESRPCVSVSESWKYCVCYLEGKILSSALQPGGIRLHFACLKTFAPIPMFWGSGGKPQQQSVVLTHLLCNDLPGLHHPGSQLFGSPWRNCLSPLRLSVKTT